MWVLVISGRGDQPVREDSNEVNCNCTRQQLVNIMTCTKTCSGQNGDVKIINNERMN